MHTRRILTVLVLLLVGVGARADDAPANGIQVPINYNSRDCKASISVPDLRKAVYTSTQMLQDDFSAILGDCKDQIKPGDDSYVIFVLITTPTDAPDADPVVVHYIGHVQKSATQSPPGTVTLPGISKAIWVYVTDQKRDVPVGSLLLTPVANPAIALIGPLISKVLPTGGGAHQNLTIGLNPNAKAYDLRLYVSETNLPLKRAKVVETDYISTPKMKGKQYVDGDGKPTSAANAVATQVSGSATFSNVPLGWYTFNAAAGVVTGTIHGAQQATSGSVTDTSGTGSSKNVYQPSPLSRTATMAGLTLHLPYDSTMTSTSWRERVGLLVGGVITPAPGIAVGPSVGARGIAITASYAWMYVSTTPDGKSFTDAIDPTSTTQFRTAAARAWIIAASYTFGGGGS